jgi:hypothetical protein
MPGGSDKCDGISIEALHGCPIDGGLGSGLSLLASTLRSAGGAERKGKERKGKERKGLVSQS